MNWIQRAVDKILQEIETCNELGKYPDPWNIEDAIEAEYQAEAAKVKELREALKPIMWKIDVGRTVSDPEYHRLRAALDALAPKENDAD